MPERTVQGKSDAVPAYDKEKVLKKSAKVEIRLNARWEFLRFIPANTLYAENTAVIDLIPAITEERFGLILNPERRKLRQELRQLFTERRTI